MTKPLSFLIVLPAVATSASAQGASAVIHGVKEGIGADGVIHGMLVPVPEPSAIAFVAVGAAALVLVMKRYK
jgi:hypothetical protein